MPKATPIAMTELKLIALDEEDLAVVSSLIQDAVVRAADMTYLPQQKRFAAIVNRFDWERAEKASGGKDYRRRRTALRFDRVFGAKLKNVKPSGSRVLSLLAVSFEPGDPPGGRVTLMGRAARVPDRGREAARPPAGRRTVGRRPPRR